MNFVRSANVFNGARFDPTPPCAITCPTINNKIHLILAEDRFFNAVFLTVGRVAESYIFCPKSFLVKDKAVRYIRGLRVHGLMQESQRLFACFGSLIGSSKFGCPVSEGIIDFRSNQRFDSDAWKDDPDNLSPLEPGQSSPIIIISPFHVLFYSLVTPGKKRDISNVPKNIHCKNPLPFSRAGSFCSRFHYFVVLNFITVPIFDGRDSFVASPAQLNQIGSRTYPLYKNSEEDIPTGCIVCVGYTAHTWQSSGSYKAPPLSLSLGLQFVVVLALPPGYDGPAPPKSVSSRPFPKPIYNTPTRTKDFPGPPRRKPSHSKPPSDNVAGSSHIPRDGNVDSDNDSPYLNGGGLKGGFEYHEDVMMLKSNRKGR